MRFNIFGAILFICWLSNPAFGETCTDKVRWQQFKNDSQGQPDAAKGKKKTCAPPPAAQTCKEVLAEPLFEGLDPKRWKACTEELGVQDKGIAVTEQAAKAPPDPSVNCRFPDDQSPAPDWVCEMQFPGDIISTFGESKLGEKDARAQAVKQFRENLAQHLLNMVQSSDDTLAADAAARKRMARLTKDAVSGFPFEAKLDTVAKARSKGGVFHVAVGAPSARVGQFVKVLLKEVLSRYKKNG